MVGGWGCRSTNWRDGYENETISHVDLRAYSTYIVKVQAYLWR